MTAADQEDVHRTIEQIARESYGRLVAYLSSHTRDVAGAEDALADYFGSLQVQLSQFPRSRERHTIRHNLCNHSPFVRGFRRERLWVEQERFRSSRPRAITPGGKDSVAGRNALGEVGPHPGTSRPLLPQLHSQVARSRNAHGRVPRLPR
jgi:hypothetical protein